MTIRNLALAMCSALVLSACGDSTGPDEISVEGSYTLETINGEGLPFVWEELDANTRIEIVAGVIRLDDNGTFSDETDVRLTQDGEVTNFDEDAVGTYTITGNTITFVVDAQHSYTATIDTSAGTITQSIEGFVLVYRR